MAAYISVPRDLTKVKSKVAFNLTKRQLLCFGTAALIGVPLFFVLRDSGGNTALFSSAPLYADNTLAHHIAKCKYYVIHFVLSYYFPLI